LEAREQKLRELGVEDWEPKPVPEPEPVVVKLCRHIRVNGKRCRSAAVSQRDYCYFHLDYRGRRLKMARARARGQHWRLELPPLEDLYAVQVGLMQVIEAMADEHLDARRGGLMLYGLQQAATNLRAPAEVWERSCRFDNVEEIEWPGFEQEHGVPAGFDIETPPEVAFPPPPARGEGNEEGQRASARGQKEAEARAQTMGQAALPRSEAAAPPEAGAKETPAATDTVGKKSPQGEGEKRRRQARNAS
jgi:hypothetical protein